VPAMFQQEFTAQNTPLGTLPTDQSIFASAV
jgi:hypothetical protein